VKPGGGRDRKSVAASSSTNPTSPSPRGSREEFDGRRDPGDRSPAPARDRAPRARRPDREGDDDARVLPPDRERADRRLQPEEQSRAGDLIRRRGRGEFAAVARGEGA